MARPWRFLAAVLALAVILAGCTNARKAKRALPAVGKPAPEITGSDQDGNSLKLSDYRGKVVLLDFWASW
jgi:cytochrome oxidase Cu insertion factor (SCO1/SenC/PrrC family)